MINNRVCHISIVHKKNDIRIFHKECVSLAKAGYEVIYISQGTHDDVESGVKLTGFQAQHNRNRLTRFLFSGRKIVKFALAQNAYIYHIHDPELIRFSKLIKRAGCKVVYDSHENSPLQIYEKEWIPKVLRPLVAAMVDWIEMKYIKYCDLIFAVADSTCERFKDYADKVIKLENLPIKKEFENIDIDYDKKSENNVFCYSGAIWKERGLLNTCFSFEKIKNVSLEIAGRIDIDPLDEFIASLPSNVSYLGYLNRKGVMKVYEKSMAGLCLFNPYPNNMIDPPTKIYEYMASGIPTICSNFKSMEEVVLTYDCGISVNPNNREEIESAIIYLSSHKDEVKRMGQNGLKAINEILNWEIHEKVLIDAYRRFL
ncbi:MAG: glycosyltransferase [Clostridia bacterium]|nr:glycosyltransferase [Clostridia bacterium]